jgi:hypothetical protein
MMPREGCAAVARLRTEPDQTGGAQPLRRPAGVPWKRTSMLQSLWSFIAAYMPPLALVVAELALVLRALV